MQAACQTLRLSQGDSFGFAAVGKLLMENAGFKAEIIEAEGTDGTHWWNLIDLGEGWYHMDATVQDEENRLFYLTDEDLMAYSLSHGNTHDYDHEKYPGVVR